MNSPLLRRSSSVLQNADIDTFLRSKARKIFHWYCEKKTCPSTLSTSAPTSLSPFQDTVTYDNDRYALYWLQDHRIVYLLQPRYYKAIVGRWVCILLHLQTSYFMFPITRVSCKRRRLGYYLVWFRAIKLTGWLISRLNH